MEINKIWINEKEKEHNLIVFGEQTLYRAMVKNAFEMQQLRGELKEGIIDDRLIGIPLSYMKAISIQEGKPSIMIEYGKESEDEIIVSDETLKKEIFDYIKSLDYFKKYTHKKPSILKRIKKPLVALMVVIGIFAYVYSIIIGLEYGYEYELRGGRRPGIGGVVLILAQLGLVYNILIFAPLAGIALYKMYTNFKKDGMIQKLSR